MTVYDKPHLAKKRCGEGVGDLIFQNLLNDVLLTSTLENFYVTTEKIRCHEVEFCLNFCSRVDYDHAVYDFFTGFAKCALKLVLMKTEMEGCK